MADTAEAQMQSRIPGTTQTEVSIQGDGLQTLDEDEKPRSKPIGSGRAILISALVVLTQLVQVS